MRAEDRKVITTSVLEKHNANRPRRWKIIKVEVLDGQTSVLEEQIFLEAARACPGNGNPLNL